MVIASEKLFFPWEKANNKPFIAFPSASYFIPDKNHVEGLLVYYKKFFLDKEHLRYKKTWNCCKFSESFKLISNLHYSRNHNNLIDETKDKLPPSISIGVIYFTKITKSGYKSPHAINMAFIYDQNKLDFIFIEPKDQKITQISEEEFESIELAVF